MNISRGEVMRARLLGGAIMERRLRDRPRPRELGRPRQVRGRHWGWRRHRVPPRGVVSDRSGGRGTGSRGRARAQPSWVRAPGRVRMEHTKLEIARDER